ncbi:YIP1 family protein [Nitrosopumilus sp.]|uniref:YIP1 family protein n=1 Tax=Nitrosopumilus sp. TaxID=2024843 RepID=UPI003D0F73D1
MNFSIIQEVLLKPNVAFEKIYQNSQYFLLSVTIFSIICVMSIFTTITSTFVYSSLDVEYDVPLIHHVVGFGNAVLDNFMIIFGIFYFGKYFDGSRIFKQVFSVISFCFTPLIIGMSLIVISNLLFSLYFSPISDDEYPSFSSEFALPSYMLSNVIIIPFFIWFIVLCVKSLKIMNHFSTFKAFVLTVIGLVVSSIVVFLYDLGTSIPLHMI